MSSKIVVDISGICRCAAIEAGILSLFTVPDSIASYSNVYFKYLLDPTPLILVVSGQSNGIGTTEFVASADFVHSTATARAMSNNYLKYVSHRNYGNSIVWYGLPCAYKLLQYFPNKLIYIIGTGVSGAPITKRNFGSGAKTWASVGSLRQQALNTIDSVLSSLPNYTMVGTLWLQGESDAGGLYSATDKDSFLLDFRESARDIIRWFLRNVGGRFFTSTIAYWYHGITGYDTYIDIINNEYAIAVDEIPNAYLATTINKTFRDGHSTWQTNPLWRDQIHYSQKGYDIVGEDFARFLVPFIK